MQRYKIVLIRISIRLIRIIEYRSKKKRKTEKKERKRKKERKKGKKDEFSDKLTRGEGKREKRKEDSSGPE